MAALFPKGFNDQTPGFAAMLIKNSPQLKYADCFLLNYFTKIICLLSILFPSTTNVYW
jgi:hypothetical protein